MAPASARRRARHDRRELSLFGCLGRPVPFAGHFGSNDTERLRTGWVPVPGMGAHHHHPGPAPTRLPP